MNNNDIGPSQAGERIQSLDIIRGFALFGILLMNIEYFQRPIQALLLGFDNSQAGLDFGVGWFVFTFVQGKFYTMFSLLFGLGFVIFLDRALARGGPARLLFMRRLGILLLIGAVHAFFIWNGDILLTYAVVGFLLLLFTKTPARRLWKWGLALFIFPVLVMWLGAAMIEAELRSPGESELIAEFEADRENIIADIAFAEEAYRHGSWLEVNRVRANEYRAMYGSIETIFFFVPFILGMFLIGAAIARSRVFHDIAANRALFRRTAVLGYGIGIPLALAWGLFGTGFELIYPTFRMAMLYTAHVLSNLALCLAYVSTVVLAGSALSRLAPMGRMALTNYLAHSIVFTLVFYGYGLGLYGEIGRAGATLMALALLAFQVWFSGWWLARYRMGPFEWVWRYLTYGHTTPFRR